MPTLIFPATPGSLEVDVVVGLDAPTTYDLVVAGQPVLAPVRARGLLDTGSNVTGIDGAILRRLGVVASRYLKTQTAAGAVQVGLYEVSLTVRNGNDPGTPGLVIPMLTVSELPVAIPGIAVLVGLDVLLQCKMILDGPARQFSLEF